MEAFEGQAKPSARNAHHVPSVQAAGFLASNCSLMTTDLGRVVTGLNLARIAVLLTLLLFAAGFYLAATTGSAAWLLITCPGVLLGLWAQFLWLSSPAGRGWALATLTSSALGSITVPVCFLDPSFAAAFWLAPLSILLTVLFATRLSSYVGRPDLARRGWLLIVVPLGLLAMAFVNPVFGLGFSLVVVLWLAFFSSYLGQVAQAVETYLAN